MRGRLLILLLVLGVVALPALALRAACAGRSCDSGEDRTAPVAFCSLEPANRELISAGFFDGRSPDALGVTGPTSVVTKLAGDLTVPWPSEPLTDLRVPLVISVPDRSGGELTENRLDQVAPTLERLLGVVRPHPEVRSGEAINGVEPLRPETPARMAVVVVWKGVGQAEVEASSAAAGVLESLGGYRGTATTGSVPLDPAAVLTTIGSGGLPSDHGIVGTLFRSGSGRVVRAFSGRAPSTVIATLGDDLDELSGGGAMVGLVAASRADRGLIGGTWYGTEDDDTVIVAKRGATGHVAELLGEGFGAGGPPDLLGVTLQGPIGQMAAATAAIAGAVRRAVPDAVLVVTATGSLATAVEPVEVQGLWRGNNAVAAAGTGGLFIDREVAAERGVSTQQVADGMRSFAAPDGSPLFVDLFPSFTVRFGTYCDRGIAT